MTALLILIPAILVILLVMVILERNSRHYVLGNLLPGPPSLPLAGHIFYLFPYPHPNKLLNTVMKLSENFGTVVRIWLGQKLIVFLLDPADIEVILSSNVHLKKSSEYRFFKPWLGDGLLISYGDKWKSHRKMIAPTFHMNILKSFMDVFNKNSQETVERMRPEIGKEFDVHDHMSGTTVDILMETAMGISRKGEDSRAGYDYAMAVMKMCDIIHQRHYKFWLRFDSIFKFTKFAKKQVDYLSTIHNLTKRVIRQRKEDYLTNREKGDNQKLYDRVTQQVEHLEQKEMQRQNKISDPAYKGLRDDLDEMDENDVGEKKRLAFLDFMIEASQNGHGINDTDIKEEVDTIMFEGHDTTAAGSSFALCLLGVHQNIQDRVMDELHEIFGDSNRPCTFNDTLNMKYLERVIFETLRMYPPVPAIAREVTEDVKLVTNNHLIPAGSTVVIGTYKMHRNPVLYPNPLQFNPDNFLPEKCQDRHYYSFIPFSAGPRSCVGRKYALLKLKVLISTILRNYKVRSVVEEKEFQLQADIILKRSDGFRIQIEPRVKTI